MITTTWIVHYNMNEDQASTETHSNKNWFEMKVKPEKEERRQTSEKGKVLWQSDNSNPWKKYEVKEEECRFFVRTETRHANIVRECWIPNGLSPHTFSADELSIDGLSPHSLSADGLNIDGLSLL